MMDRETIEEKADMKTQDRAGTPDSRSRENGLLSRRSARWIFALIAIVLIIGGYFIYQNYFSYRESTDDAQIDGHINPVAAKVSGHVVSINVKDYQSVKAGTVIVQIDPRDYLVALERAKADLAAAQSLAEAAHTQVPMTYTH
jgi:membrane fusion protein (multidrug efflux system)